MRRPDACLHAQVIALCEKERDPPLQQIVVDTPGQIEIFTWSASGAIITEVGKSPAAQRPFSPMLSPPANLPSLRCLRLQSSLSCQRQWCASAALQAFANSGFPTCVAFVLDTPRCSHPQTFMSNMLQVSSLQPASLSRDHWLLAFRVSAARIYMWLHQEVHVW